MDPWKELAQIDARVELGPMSELKSLVIAHANIRARMAACYEACEGIENPKAAIELARRGLELGWSCNDSAKAHLEIEAALSALTPKTDSEAGRSEA